MAKSMKRKRREPSPLGDDELERVEAWTEGKSSSELQGFREKLERVMEGAMQRAQLRAWQSMFDLEEDDEEEDALPLACKLFHQLTHAEYCRLNEPTDAIGHKTGHLFVLGFLYQGRVGKICTENSSIRITDAVDDEDEKSVAFEAGDNIEIFKYKEDRSDKSRKKLNSCLRRWILCMLNLKSIDDRTVNFMQDFISDHLRDLPRGGDELAECWPYSPDPPQSPVQKET